MSDTKIAISKDSAENAFEDESIMKDLPRKEFIVPPPVASTSVEELMASSENQILINSIEDAKFLKCLSGANKFLRGYMFPFDGQRTLNINKYRGKLDVITVEKIMESTTYLSWDTIRKGTRKLVGDFIKTMKLNVMKDNLKKYNDIIANSINNDKKDGDTHIKKSLSTDSSMKNTRKKISEDNNERNIKKKDSIDNNTGDIKKKSSIDINIKGKLSLDSKRNSDKDIKKKDSLDKESNIQNFYLYIPSRDKISSEVVLITETWDLWEKFQSRGFFEINSIVMDEKEISIVVVDDWSITGHTKAEMIDQITTNNPNVKINFHFLIPYMSQTSKRIINMFPNVKISTMDDNWDIDHITFDHNELRDNKNELSNNLLYLIYSDLKIPIADTCPKKFYSQCILNPPFNIKFVLETFFTKSKATPM